MAQIRRMFPGGNTARGFYSFHHDIIVDNRKMLYILKGMPGGGKSSLMKVVGEKALEEGYSIEYHHCPSDPESVDGVHIPELEIAIVDGTAPHIIDPVYPGLKDKLIDLGAFIDGEKLVKNQKAIINAKANNKIAYSRAYGYFKSAEIIGDLIIDNNKRGMDYSKLNREILKLIDEIFSKDYREMGKSKTRHMFSSAYTPEGYIDLTHTLLEDPNVIYYINGEIGTGKSTIMEKLVERAYLENYSMEIYHNPMIPEKIETIIIGQLNICITSNKTALEFPHRVIDLNNYFDSTVKKDKDYATYNSLVEEGIMNLHLAKENHKILEESYKTAIDYNGINNIIEKIIGEIF